MSLARDAEKMLLYQKKFNLRSKKRNTKGNKNEKSMASNHT
jgi:hypothetical protein